VQVCASDLATVGSPKHCLLAGETVNVNNTASSPTYPRAGVERQLRGNDSETITTPYGHPPSQGRPRKQCRRPDRGSAICVQAQTEGTRWTGTDRPATGRNGHSDEPPPNRSLLIGYRHDAFQVGRTISYASHTRRRFS